MKRITFGFFLASSMIALMRSSNWPLNFVPATTAAMSRDMMRLSNSRRDTLCSFMRIANPSTIADLPTPGSPISTGLFFFRRLRIWITRSISVALPTTGSRLPSSAAFVMSLPNLSSTGVSFWLFSTRSCFFVGLLFFWGLSSGKPSSSAVSSFSSSVFTVLFATLLGLFNNYLFDKYNSILPGILIHSAYNFMVTFIKYNINNLNFEAYEIPIIAISIIIFIISVIGVIFNTKKLDCSYGGENK